MRKLLRYSVSALLLAGCASTAAAPPETRTAIKRYYERHASENIGQCLAPYIDGFTAIQVVESDSERMVLDVRYLYRDWIEDERANQGMFNPCIGYGERRFVLAKSEGTWKVEDMSGPQRGPGPRPDGETTSG